MFRPSRDYVVLCFNLYLDFIPGRFLVLLWHYHDNLSIVCRQNDPPLKGSDGVPSPCSDCHDNEPWRCHQLACFIPCTRRFQIHLGLVNKRRRTGSIALRFLFLSKKVNWGEKKWNAASNSGTFFHLPGDWTPYIQHPAIISHHTHTAGFCSKLRRQTPTVCLGCVKSSSSEEPECSPNTEVMDNKTSLGW